MTQPIAPELNSTSRLAWILLLLNRLHYSSVVLSSFAFGLFLPFIRDDLDLSDLETGLLQGVWWLTTAVMLVPFSAFVGRFNPNAVVIASLALIVPFAVTQGLAIGFWTLLASRFLTVFAYSTAAPARPLLLDRWVAPRDYATVSALGLSAHAALLGAVVSLSPLIIVTLGSWRTAYFFQGGLMFAHLIMWIALARNMPRSVEPASRSRETTTSMQLSSLFRYPQAWLSGVVMFCLAASWTTLVTFLPTLLEDRGIEVSVSGPLLGFLYYALIPGALLGGRIGRLFANRKLLLTVTAIGNTAFTFWALMSNDPLLVGVALTGLGLVWIFVPAIEVLPFEFRGIEAQEVAVLTSLNLTMMAVGFAIGPVAAGAIAESTGSLETGVLVLAGTTLIGIAAGLVFPTSLARSGSRRGSE